MRLFWRWALFGFWIHATPSLEEIAKLARLDEINVIINKAVARLKPQAAVFAVDPVGAAPVTEDLDYRAAAMGWETPNVRPVLFLRAGRRGRDLEACDRGATGPPDRSPHGSAHSGEIPWSWAIDETRSLDDFGGFKSIAVGIEAYMNAIRLDPWDGEAPLILTESRSLAGVLRELMREYSVMIASTIATRYAEGPRASTPRARGSFWPLVPSVPILFYRSQAA